MPNDPNCNSANFNSGADWNGQNGNVTTVGTNGGPSYYLTYDQTGNIKEWNYSTIDSINKGLRGGSWADTSANLTSRGSQDPKISTNVNGFRIATISDQYGFSSFVDIANSGNTADSTTYGAVSYNYKIQTYPVTNTEYTAFLNAVASTDTNAVYLLSMGSKVGGISRTGNSGSYVYSVRTNMGNKPVCFISWFMAARFANWLHNNRISGLQSDTTTEDGSYNLDGTNLVTKSESAKYWIPTEDEWYKAAYYDPDKSGGGPGYWDYASQSDSAPTAVTATDTGDGSLPSVCVTPTPTPTITLTRTPTITITPTITLTKTPTITITPSVTPTLTITPSATQTLTPTVTKTPTKTPTITPTVTKTITRTPTVTRTITPTITITKTITPTPTITPTITNTPSKTFNPPHKIGQLIFDQKIYGKNDLTVIYKGFKLVGNIKTPIIEVREPFDVTPTPTVTQTPTSTPISYDLVITSLPSSVAAASDSGISQFISNQQGDRLSLNSRSLTGGNVLIAQLYLDGSEIASFSYDPIYASATFSYYRASNNISYRRNIKLGRIDL